MLSKGMVSDYLNYKVRTECVKKKRPVTAIEHACIITGFCLQYFNPLAPSIEVIDIVMLKILHYR